MKVLFVSCLHYSGIKGHGIYVDLMRKFVDEGHSLYVLCSSVTEKSSKEVIDGVTFIYTGSTNQVGNNNLIKKGLNLIGMERLYVKTYKKYCNEENFDLVYYATPPITLCGLIKEIKKTTNAKTYLMLKDIFPQNSVDLNMLSTKGYKSVIYHYFRRKEKQLYKFSDYIGCMSQANVNYLIEKNDIKDKIVEVLPNCIDALDFSITNDEKFEFRKKVGLPTDKLVFVFGGNLGKPQNVPFMVDCFKACKDIDSVVFAVAGNGTEYTYLEKRVKDENIDNVYPLGILSHEEYDVFITCCDVGLVFLDYRFTIPNFPSKILSYMQVSLPILSCTDDSTDVGAIIVDNGFGWSCKSNSAENFARLVREISKNEKLLPKMGRLGNIYLKDNYSVDFAYETIVNHFKGISNDTCFE